MKVSPLINTPLQRGDATSRGGENRFNGFPGGGETIKMVLSCTMAFNTPLKQGVNESGLFSNLTTANLSG